MKYSQHSYETKVAKVVKDDDLTFVHLESTGRLAGVNAGELLTFTGECPEFKEGVNVTITIEVFGGAR